MIQTLRNTLSVMVLVGVATFTFTSPVSAQGLRTNQGNFGSGWQVGGNTGTDSSPYGGAAAGTPPTSSGHGGSSGASYGGSSGSQGSYGGSGNYSGYGSYGGSGTSGSTAYGSTDSGYGSGSAGAVTAPRSAGGGLRVQ